MKYGEGIASSVALLHQADCDVLSRACQGDPEAFAETYRRYRTRIYAFCLARLLSRELAEDAAQETFVRFLSADTAAVANPRAWLFKVARNVCTDIWRQRQREGTEPVAEIEDIAATLSAVRDTADEAQAARDTRNALLALRRMRTRYRVALLLREMHGLPVSEIAESMGIGVGAAHTLLSRARDAFARSYAELSGRPESCVDALTLLYRAEGHALTGPEQDRLDAHLEECRWCNDQSSTCFPLGHPSRIGRPSHRPAGCSPGLRSRLCLLPATRMRRARTRCPGRQANPRARLRPDPHRPSSPYSRERLSLAPAWRQSHPTAQ